MNSAPVTAPPVLVVDDADPMRKLVGSVLRGAGFDVIEAADGEAALEKASQLGRLTAAVTDVCMPNRHGFSLAMQLRKQQPGLPMIFMSAFEVDHAAIGPDAKLLLKPFTPDQLLRAIRALVGTPALQA